MKHKINHIYFVGIGGSGMGGIAEVLINQGYQVSGSDLSENTVTDRLCHLGAIIHRQHAAENIGTADVVVYSSAIKTDNPEMLAARERHIPIVPRAIMLAELLRLRRGIAVAGTHGKTTTTSLIASILAEADMDPTFVIGGRLKTLGSHARMGDGEFIVVEADESDASFLYLQPVLTVVTNIDADHMSTYGHDFGRLKQTFIEFIEHLPFYGMAMLCIDDPHVREIIPMITKPVTTYGLTDEAQVYATEIHPDHGKMHFVAHVGVNGSARQLPVTLNLPGLHNVQNALAAIAIANELNISDLAITAALAGFGGVERRFQYYGEIDLPGRGVFSLVDDYGHHPAEIMATLAAAKGAFPGRRLLLAFQPHRFSRTRDLFEDFVKALSQTDVLLLTEVYAAGEDPIIAADSKSLARAIRVHGKLEPIYVEQVDELPDAIQTIARDGDVVVIMGAGAIGKLAAEIAQPVKKMALIGV
ncbi:MAG: UDP-N-acetylmuramate--L-alanine ligase [Nitrosomonas sp.]|nr:UDP-N-acetylmuramate--L-alanine ligase [Nitrosomonas sp.]